MIQTKVERIATNLVKLEVEVDSETVAKAMSEVYQQNIKKYNVKGFRKGKAPLKVFAQQYDKFFDGEVINKVCPSAYEEALRTHEIYAVESPTVQIKQMEINKSLIFEVSVTVKPEVTLGQYKDLEIRHIINAVTDEDVNREIEYVQDKNARMVGVDNRPVQEKDIITVDFEGSIDGLVIPNSKCENFDLEIGKKQLIPGFEEALIGAEIGKEKAISVTFPEQYHVINLAGKNAIFNVLVKSINEKHLPELDDEFARDVSEFDTFEEYKNDIKRQLEEVARNESEEQFEKEVLETIVNNTTMDIPNVMFENRIGQLIEEFTRKLFTQQMNLQKYMDRFKLTYEDVRNKFREQAQKEVKNRLVLEEIAKIEGIDAELSELEEEMETLSKKHNISKEELLQKHIVENLKDSIKIRKTVDFVKKNTKKI